METIALQKERVIAYLQESNNTGVLLLDLLRDGIITSELYAEMLGKEQKSYELFIKNMMKKGYPTQNELAQSELFNDDSD